MSKTSNETELSLYARLDDPESLEQAEHIEDHIQLETKLVSGARQRVRRIIPVKGGPDGAGDAYELTLKVKKSDEAGVPSSIEVTQETDRGFYLAYAEVASRGIVKRRYTFLGTTPIIEGVSEDLVLPPVKYEVDRFKIHSTGEYSDWIKIDIELDDILEALNKAGISTEGLRQKFNLKNLPFTSHDMFAPNNMSPQQKQLLDRLWAEEFAIKIAKEIFVETDNRSDQADVVDNKPAADSDPAQSQLESEAA